MSYENLSPLFFVAENFTGISQRYASLVNGLISFIPIVHSSGRPTDRIRNLTSTLVGTASVVNDYQAGTISASGSGNYVDFGTDVNFISDNLGPSPGLTIAIMHSPLSTALSCLWTYADSSSNYCPGALVYSTTTPNSQYAFWNDNNLTGPTSNPTTFGVGTRNFVIGRRTGAQYSSPTCDLFVNGALLGTTTSTPAQVTVGGAPHTFTINRFGSFSGYSGSGLFGPLYIWNRALSDGEIAVLSEDPYGLVRREVRNLSYLFVKTSSVRVTVSASADVVITSSVGVVASFDSSVVTPGTILTDQLPSVPAVVDTTPTSVGTQFFSDVFGHVKHIRWYNGRAPGVRTHKVGLYTQDGSILSEVEFTAYLETGWQVTELPDAIEIDPAYKYVAAVFFPAGEYPKSDAALTTQIDNTDSGMHAYASGGVKAVAADLTFPTDPT